MTELVCYKNREIEDLSQIDTGIKCNTCGVMLDIGDFIDMLYPYYSEFNICKECNKHI